MIIANTLLLAVLASCALAGAAQYGYDADPVFASALTPRDSCSELPQLCTDLVTLHGMATMLTYLCPEPTALSTVHVTQTMTTTVTVAPTGNGDPQSTKTSDEDPTGSEEATTTTTVRSTVTEHRTITLVHSTDGSKSSVRTSVMTEPSSESQSLDMPTFMLPIITESFSKAAPTKANVTSSMLAPTAIYRNKTSYSGYAKPTISLFRGAKASDSVIPFKGIAGHHDVPYIVLLLGTMIAAASV
ncbi:hypothetical protein IAQ61_002797 [Plenodomus lingam]|uniref:Predicted protein n=1 Tax=Leptosphaeria maculans (strain JN3 / isolate v23.1.3 / race Av1-4-5-6-7-8) TaxID=985895 RepID=E5A8P4_LEPMJ|nr:predicted protein [Plenodomus lingam JN3]KAH9877431.1 hypothetical protein IAQ61_002797 [Plenodomus lingam]CBX99989.1 predicted protein [Plenodomus lingam JN3]